MPATRPGWGGVPASPGRGVSAGGAAAQGRGRPQRDAPLPPAQWWV